MDVLTDVLSTLDLKSCLCVCAEMPAPWRIHYKASQDSCFHIINFGSGYLRIEGETAPIPVKNGDVIVLPHGHAHEICDDLASPLTISVQLDYDNQPGYQVLPFEGNGPKTILLCGVFHFEHPGDYPLLRSLPKLIHIPGEQGRMVDGLADTLRQITREANTRRPGAEVMLRRLTEMLFIQAVRVWIENQSQATCGWLGALQDLPISTALGLIHQSPQQRWKVEELADAVALSRTAFSTRFTQLVGEPPMKYLTRWRMHLAMRMLKKEMQTEKIAQQLGYDSEVAFRKAFKREIGVAPARYRRQVQ